MVGRSAAAGNACAIDGVSTKRRAERGRYLLQFDSGVLIFGEMIALNMSPQITRTNAFSIIAFWTVEADVLALFDGEEDCIGSRTGCRWPDVGVRSFVTWHIEDHWLQKGTTEVLEQQRFGLV